MAKLYAITQGYYSDYTIVSLCSDKETAEKVKAKINSMKGEYDDECCIEEYEDGKFCLGENVCGWLVIFDKDGNVLSVEQADFTEGVKGLTYGQRGYNGKTFQKVFIQTVAPDEQSAIKIAAEKRAMYLAQENGI